MQPSCGQGWGFSPVSDAGRQLKSLSQSQSGLTSAQMFCETERKAESQRNIDKEPQYAHFELSENALLQIGQTCGFTVSCVRCKQGQTMSLVGRDVTYGVHGQRGGGRKGSATAREIASEGSCSTQDCQGSLCWPPFDYSLSSLCRRRCTVRDACSENA